MSEPMSDNLFQRFKDCTYTDVDVQRLVNYYIEQVMPEPERGDEGTMDDTDTMELLDLCFDRDGEPFRPQYTEMEKRLALYEALRAAAKTVLMEVTCLSVEDERYLTKLASAVSAITWPPGAGKGDGK